MELRKINKLPEKASIIYQSLVGMAKAFGIEQPTDFKKLLDDADPFAPHEGEELHRPMTEEEVGCRLYLYALIDYLETMSAVDIADQWVIQFFSPLVKAFSDASYSLCMETMLRKKSPPIYCGLRRYEEKLWWVFRRPTAEEALEDQLLEMMKTAKGCGTPGCTCSGSGGRTVH